MNNRDALLHLNMIDGLGPRGITKICDHFPRVQDVFGQSHEFLRAQLGFNEKVSKGILEAPGLECFKREKAFIEKNGVHILILEDSDYPELLAKITDPPPILYLLGKKAISEIAVGVVGARRASVYGKEVALRLGYEIGAHGITLVSGFARGIDTQAHCGALQAKGATYGVLGSGLGEIYPAENQRWVQKMLDQGGLISEFPSFTKPLAGHFPRRNRIISGLSLGVVVVEASRKSGALITADFALEQGREVFAVPGSVHSPNTKGVHALIKQGARLVENVDDIIEELGLNARTSNDEKRSVLQVALTENEKKILSSLNTEPVAIDQICQKTGIPSQTVASLLFGLEMKKMVKQFPGKYYVVSISNQLSEEIDSLAR